VRILSFGSSLTELQCQSVEVAEIMCILVDEVRLGACAPPGVRALKQRCLGLASRVTNIYGLLVRSPVFEGRKLVCAYFCRWSVVAALKERIAGEDWMHEGFGWRSCSELLRPVLKLHLPASHVGYLLDLGQWH
jgi:hypothetical protein